MASSSAGRRDRTQSTATQGCWAGRVSLGRRVAHVASSQILVLNCGSSSVKWAVGDPESGETSAQGLAERLGGPLARVRTREGDSDWQDTDSPGLSPEDAVAKAIELVGETRLAGVGHRVVQGGERFAQSVRIDDD